MAGGVRRREDLRCVVHELDVQDVDRQLRGGIRGTLLVGAEVDDRADAVVDEGAPAFVAQAPDRVRPNDPSELRLAAALD